ncbi:MAG: preprotein translocase subunit SecA [Ruminococcaceae bacterium]|nr:preprotein translocase subunit SecA [Oscillospiraceae bacterium]
MSLLKKIFGTHSSRELKKIYPIVDKIEKISEEYTKLTDEELKAKTPEFKRRYKDGETLDELLPEAFAAVREAATRVLGERHYRVQLIGGVILHQGRIAEMKTGEGKTLVSTLPAYLNALTGEGVHIVTVNDYLAKRDSEWMGKIYRFMGLSVGLIVHGLTNEQRKEAYKADITYGTNNELGFDYLRDNMVLHAENMVQRGHVFAIVDEVDSILIDEARTPLIISGIGEKPTDMYKMADRFARSLKQVRVKEIDTKEDTDQLGGDYIVDEKARSAVLTTSGVEKAEKAFGVENLSDVENTELSHYINQAIKAHGIMKRDVDYVVRDGEVIIVDEFTGRLMFGRRYSDGLHQAIEAKENVTVENESKTLATITFQNFFRLYRKLSGMTGTALTEEDEFRDIYSLDVIEIPTNKPIARVDKSDVVYKSEKGKFRAVIAKIRESHEKGQPVLVGTVSIEKSEILSDMLKKEGIKHVVLNAKQHDKEAEIVAQAGKKGAVTIATNMAGRGTDISLGGNAEYMAKSEMRKNGYEDALIDEATGHAETQDEAIIEARNTFRTLLAKYKAETSGEAQQVRDAGGLCIIGTERHESRRIDNQLRGRAGRQGDPGESQFFLSLEDDLMRLFGGDRVTSLVGTLGLSEDDPIEASILSNTIENAQKKLEGMNFQRRKNVLRYDEVMNQQREIIYGERQKVLQGENLKDTILKMIPDIMRSELDLHSSENDNAHEGILDASALVPVKQAFSYVLHEGDFDTSVQETYTREQVIEMLVERAMQRYEEQEKLIGSERLRELERVVMLKAVDNKWMDHLDQMDQLRAGVNLSAYGQKDPVVEYKFESFDMFDGMINEIKTETVRTILSIRVVRDDDLKRKQVAKANLESLGGSEEKPAKKPVKNAAEKVGRNDPCPCGSGLKYKKCCGR